ncbi:hypothetical protein [Bosea sp. AS-1]|uniref:hypothetical protein n=1 Tax=Bosea sp. AS-1 TaxID=2015316 RepID=UPI0012FDF6BD|nr:hypothetical protein [Bosea sp. AS-1]
MAIERDRHGAPTDPALKAGWHLLCLWFEHEPPFADEKGVLHFEHYASGAREGVAGYLEELGLGVNQGWTFMPNTAGIELLGFLAEPVKGGRKPVGWETVYNDPKETHGGRE